MVNKARLEDRLVQLSKIGKLGETGVCRLAHSKEDREAVELVQIWMREAGLKTKIDHFGNLIGRLNGKEEDAPVLMLGSHIDSQPAGGRFDGSIGVLGALEIVQSMKENQIIPSRPIEVIAFSDEEGCRFNKGLYGSKGIIGETDESDLERQDQKGINRREALKQFGVNPDLWEKSIYPKGSINAYLELHIEQGPILEHENDPVGIVTGIAGPLWLTVEFEGFAGHAGSVPMPLRRDALVGASEVIAEFNQLVKDQSETVGTVGHLNIHPNSRNIIPDKVTFTIDLRDIDLERRNKIEEKLMNFIKDTCQKHHLTFTIREDTRSEPRYCADWIIETMEGEAKQMGRHAPKLMSGPFHDALPLSKVCDYGMIFVRCKNGISHNPLEYSKIEDILLGTELMEQTVLKMTRQ